MQFDSGILLLKVFLLSGALVFCSCKQESNCVEVIEGTHGVMYFISAHGTSEIMSNEAGIQPEGNTKSSRESQVRSRLHIKFKIVSSDEMDDSRIDLSNHLVKEDLSLFQGGSQLNQVLYLNESGFARRNQLQYVLAYSGETSDIFNDDIEVQFKGLDSIQYAVILNKKCFN